jgi:hypothetical protein
MLHRLYAQVWCTIEWIKKSTLNGEQTKGRTEEVSVFQMPLQCDCVSRVEPHTGVSHVMREQDAMLIGAHGPRPPSLSGRGMYSRTSRVERPRVAAALRLPASKRSYQLPAGGGGVRH